MDATVDRPAEYYTDYDELREHIEATDKDLLRPDPRFLSGQIATVSGSLAASVALLWIAGDIFAVVFISAALAAFGFGQAGYMMHDACHGVGGVRWKRPARLWFNVLFNWSMDWWAWKHNRHHEDPNDPLRDPDLLVEVVAFTPQQARAKRGLSRSIARHQDRLFFPLLSLEAGNLRVAITRYLLKQGTREARVDLLLMAVHTFVYLGTLFYSLPFSHALAFVLVHNALLGLYLGLAFAINHIGMEIAGSEKGLDYLRQQMQTTRNVPGGPWLTRFFGGLNFQIEHHLFPWLTWNQLRKIAPFVREFALQKSVAYHAVPLRIAYHEVRGHFRAMARSVP